MANFENSDYKCLLTDCLNDAFYSSTSNRGKIAHIRQLAEIIVRKLIDLPSSESLMLGQKLIKSRIKKLKNSTHIQKCINAIIHDDGKSHRGNSCSHTGIIDCIEEKEYHEAHDCLLDLIACLFINYFEEYPFGSNTLILSNFSLLPPIIRYKVLKFLYSKNANNLFVIDKLILSMRKSFGIEHTRTWIENNKEHLNSLYSSINNSTLPSEYPDSYMISMYDWCKIKIDSSDNYPKMYETIEQAKTVYLEKNTLYDTSEEVSIFKDLMEFVFLGRNEEPLPIDHEPLYVICHFTQLSE